MTPKPEPKSSSEYSSLEEYRKAFFPDSIEKTPLDASDAASFGAKLAREVLRKALEASEKGSEGEKGKGQEPRSPGHEKS